MTPIGAAALPRDLSPWGMFMSADIVVKAVMIGLAFASVVTWTVWLAKTIELSWPARRGCAQALQALSVRALARRRRAQRSRRGAVRRRSSMRPRRELQLSADVDRQGRHQGARRLAAASASRRRPAAASTRGTGVLATIGATAPFVGLFGTVWGIMNSFIGISKAQTTNLAVVAPGIAEALLATAIGLVAAIPAVVIYNRVRALDRAAIAALLGDASAEVLRLVSARSRPRAASPASELPQRRRSDGHGGAARPRRRTTSPKLHEINVTPFIDVMLVLLIIFMVAAPLATVDVAVDLPVVDGASRSRGPTSRCS